MGKGASTPVHLQQLLLSLLLLSLLLRPRLVLLLPRCGAATPPCRTSGCASW